MNEQSIPAPRLNVFGRPGLPNGFAVLVMMVIFTQATALLMNQPAAYWLNREYTLTGLPFGSLLAGGPLLYLGFEILYLAIVGLLLRRLNASAGFFLAVALVPIHSFALFKTTVCGFYPLFKSHGTAACYAYQYVPLVIITIVFILTLLVERLPDRLVHWGKRILISLAVLWIFLMGLGVFRATFPPLSPWKALAPEHSPGPRTMAAIAYDSQRQRAVLFGGISLWDGKQWVYDNSTWEWDGKDWEKIKTPLAPTGRILHAMAYDEAHAKIILYGGQNANGSLADLWEWDGLTWHRLCPVCNPAARFSHKMIFDTGRQQIILYGGGDEKTGFAEGWTWDGQSWSYLQIDSSAPAVYNAPLIYDRRREWAVSFMGREWGGTWIWEASTWRKLDPSIQPPVRDEAALVYDPVQDHSVLFGGIRNDNFLFNDTWIFDGENWRKLNTPSAPPQRNKAVAFYDPVRHSVILYGGEQPGSSIHSDMWELVLPGDNEP